MTNEDHATPPTRRVPDPLVMPFANVRHLSFRDKVATSLPSLPVLAINSDGRFRTSATADDWKSYAHV